MYAYDFSCLTVVSMALLGVGLFFGGLTALLVAGARKFSVTHKHKSVTKFYSVFCYEEIQCVTDSQT